MPPPPPPSKSYLIQITDSDLEDDDEVELNQPLGSERISSPSLNITLQQEPQKPLAVKRNDTLETLPSQDDEEEDDDDDDDNNEDDAGDDGVLEQDSLKERKARRNKKKKKNRKRKKQQNKISNQVTTTTAPKKDAKRIQFESVSITCFDRCLGMDGVPLDGGWPLGLSEEIARSTVTVEEYEATKQERLLQRWKKCFPLLEIPDSVLETRQWDYKQSARNPLFGLVTEKHRMALLLGEQDFNEILCEKYEKDRQKSKDNSKNSPKKNQNSGRGGGGPKLHSTRSRSGSGSSNHGERYNEIFNEYEVHQVRNSLEKLRTMRTQEEARGCSCRRLEVYIPPPDAAGKKASHRRLSAQKVKEELRKRHALTNNTNMKREELELLLHDLVAQEPCCRDDNCTCVKNGIDCQSDSCACWHASHQSSSKKTIDTIITPDIIQNRCGNKFGMYTVDMHLIRKYREPFLTYCQPIIAIAEQ